MSALLALAGCTGLGSAYIPGLAPPNLPRYGQAAPTYATSGYAPPGYQQVPPPAQAAQNQEPHDYERSRDIEIREKVPADDAWCRQPYVADTLREIYNMRTEIGLRRAAEMSGLTAPENLTPYLVTTIVGMGAGEHRCIGVPRDRCLGSGHLCRGLVMQGRREPVWTTFAIEGEHFDNAVWRRDEVQY